MDNPIYIGNCPTCHEYGMLEVVVNIKTHFCSVMCDECCAEWKTPEDAVNNMNGFREFNSTTRVRTATMEEIIGQGWEIFINNNNAITEK